MFFGWGVLVAIFSVLVAPAIKRRLGTVGALGAVFALFAADLLATALEIGNQAALIVCVVLTGAFIGVVNTVLTEAVMKVAPVERPIASSAYSFLRFGGGAVAPWLAGRLAEDLSPDAPYFVGAGAVVVAAILLVAWRGVIGAADERAPERAVIVVPEPVPAVVAIASGPAPERRVKVEVVHGLEVVVVEPAPVAA